MRSATSTGTMSKREIDLDDYVIGNLSRIANKLARGASKVYRDRFNIGITEWRVLNALSYSGVETARQVCDLTGIDKAPVSRGLRSLKGAGYVVSHTDRRDRRRTLLRLTEQGVRLHQRIVPVAFEREATLLATLTDREQVALKGLLLKLRAVVPVLDHEPVVDQADNPSDAAAE